MKKKYIDDQTTLLDAFMVKRGLIKGLPGYTNEQWQRLSTKRNQLNYVLHEFSLNEQYAIIFENKPFEFPGWSIYGYMTDGQSKRRPRI